MILLLVALTVGAAAAVAVTLVSVAGTTAAGASPAPPFSTRAVVVASASCTDPVARDLVEFRGPDGRPVTMPLDACGTRPATIVPVTVPAGAHVAQLGDAGRPSGAAPQQSPMAGRLAVTLGAVATLGVAGLLVALGRRLWSQPGSQPGSQAGNQAGSRPGSEGRGRSSRRPARAPSGR